MLERLSMASSFCATIGCRAVYDPMVTTLKPYSRYGAYYNSCRGALSSTPRRTAHPPAAPPECTLGQKQGPRLAMRSYPFSLRERELEAPSGHAQRGRLMMH